MLRRQINLTILLSSSSLQEIQYARDKSFVIAEKDGTIEETKRKRDEKQSNL